MARIGTEKRPAFLRVKTERRLQEIATICGNNSIHFVIELAPDKPEDVSDMDLALRPPEPVVAGPKIGRNDPCSCGSGSGKKFKKCCAAALPSGT